MVQYDDLIQHTFAIAGEHDDRLQSVDLRWTKHPLELRPGLHDGPELQQGGS